MGEASLIALAPAEISIYNYLMNKDIQSSRGISREQAMRMVRAVRVEQVVNDAVDEEVSQFLGINRTDGRCIDIVERLGRVTAGTLAAESGLTTGAVTALVDRLEAAGYLQRVRDTGDRRRVFIELTPLMKELTKKLFYNMEGMYRAVLERMTPEDAAIIAFFLEAGTYINRQRVRLMREHLPGRKATSEERLAAAAAYDRSARQIADDIDRAIRDERFSLEPDSGA